MKTTLNPHPRLYIGPREITRMREPLDTPQLQTAGEELQRLADRALPSPVFDWDRNGHNAHLGRARQMQARVVTLIVQWLRTSDVRYAKSAIEHIAEMDRWEHWSWLAWRNGDRDPNAIFDLSCGENSATVALAYDLLYPILTAEQRRLFVGVARRRSLVPFLTRNRNDRQCSTWWTDPTTNWLTVCAGGAGMLCLSMYEDLPEARRLLPRIDRHLLPYMQHAQKCGGGWPEGVAYWAYGMRYGFMYWLSHERATGRPHPAMRLSAARETLWFPMDFAPNKIGAGFGDIVTGYFSQGFHYAAADRFRDRRLISELDNRLSPKFARETHRPTAAEYLLFHPRTHREISAKSSPRPRPAARLFPAMEWGYLADQMPDPAAYLSFRAGSTTDHHAHLDVLSFNCIFGQEAFLQPSVSKTYLDTTFSNRCFEMFEKSWLGKNTLVIGGVGISHPAHAHAAPIKFPSAHGYRLSANKAISIRFRGEQVRQITRVFLLLPEDKVFIVLDRVLLKSVNAIEARFCTPVLAEISENTAQLIGQSAVASLSFAATAPCTLVTAQTIPTLPSIPVSTLLRWCTTELQRDILFATAIAPGKSPVQLSLARDGKGFRVAVGLRDGGRPTQLRLTSSLHPQRR